MSNSPELENIETFVANRLHCTSPSGVIILHTISYKETPYVYVYGRSLFKPAYIKRTDALQAVNTPSFNPLLSIYSPPNPSMPRDSTYVPSTTTGSVGSEIDGRSNADLVVTVLRSGLFEYRGHGLLVDGFPCETPAELKRLLKPDEVSGHTLKHNYKRCKKWWRAQCIHYGIRVPANATINTYRAYLGSAIPHQAELKRPREHILLEKQLNREYFNRDAKPYGKGEVDMTPVLTAKRHDLETHDQVAKGNKRLCVAEPLSDPHTHTPNDLDVPRLNYLDVLRQHGLNKFIGMYNLTLSENSPVTRSGHAATLVIAAGFDHLRFEGYVKLPGIISCALVFELGTFSQQADRRITIRFKWRGKRSFTSDPLQVGQLTLDLEHRRLKGLIDGPVQVKFKGARISSAQRELPHRWEDLDGTSH